MNIYKKLQAARVKLHNTQLNKSGKNSFAKFNYFELGDFIPAVTQIFDELGMCGIVNFSNEYAHLTIHNADNPEERILFTTPLVHANMDRVQAIQNLGATHTYLRRYLWLMAMEIVENDVVDAAEPVAKATPAPAPKAAPKAAPESKEETSKKLDMKGKPGAWQIQITGEGEWDQLIIDAAKIQLSVAQTPEDCVNIFKVNHTIFEKMKAEYPPRYDELMAEFKTRKNALTPKE